MLLIFTITLLPELEMGREGGGSGEREENPDDREMLIPLSLVNQRLTLISAHFSVGQSGAGGSRGGGA